MSPSHGVQWRRASRSATVPRAASRSPFLREAAPPPPRSPSFHASGLFITTAGVGPPSIAARREGPSCRRGDLGARPGSMRSRTAASPQPSFAAPSRTGRWRAPPAAIRTAPGMRIDNYGDSALNRPFALFRRPAPALAPACAAAGCAPSALRCASGNPAILPAARCFRPGAAARTFPDRPARRADRRSGRSAAGPRASGSRHRRRGRDGRARSTISSPVGAPPAARAPAGRMLRIRLGLSET